MRIFLLGFMGVGKSTLGRLLAVRVSLPFVDLDEWIEDKMEMSIAEIFSSYGEPFFRKLEHDNLREITETYDRFVMATGGGLPCYNGNLEMMNKQGLTVYLRASGAELASRLASSLGKRPVLDAMDPAGRYRHIASLLAQREVIYSRAKVTVDLSLAASKEDNVDQIMAACSEEE